MVPRNGDDEVFHAMNGSRKRLGRASSGEMEEASVDKNLCLLIALCSLLQVHEGVQILIAGVIQDLGKFGVYLEQLENLSVQWCS